MKIKFGFIAAGLLLFGASFSHPFHFDDALITNDSNVTNPGQWAHFFNPLYLRQLTFFSFYLNHLAGGLNPAGFHLVNVALHIANAVLFYVLLRRFFEQWIAIAAAAVFLVHPIQTEPVLYVYQRSILLACLFSLLGLIALVERRPGWALLAFFLAFESKESALAVPLAVALLSGTKQLISTRYVRWVLLAVALLLGIATLIVLAYVNERTVGIGAAERINPLRYQLTQTRVVFTYLRLLVFPYPQSLEYEFQNAGGFLTAAGMVLLIVGAWLLRRRIWGWCGLAFFILLAPTSSIIPSADAAFEHRLYLPMLAFALFVAWLISKTPKRTWVAVSLLIILSVSTLRREKVWSSDITLWEDTVQRAPGKARVWFNLGGAYLSANPDKAREAFLRTLELQPHFPEALYDLGVIEQGKKNWSSALSYYERALVQEPGYWPAANNMGNTLFAMGQLGRSLQFFEKTLSLNRHYWPAQYNIAIVHFMSGRYTDAVPRLRTVLDWQPDFREARYLLATSLTRSGDRALADVEWTKLGEVNAAESRHTPTMILAPSRP
jgi:tetratricopeptide (TPR) repeat protein